MFKRRHPISKLHFLREILWPSMGWRRTVIFLKHRILRLSDSTHKIARGMACGASMSFSPILGTHFIQAGVLSYVIKGNLLASMVGTFAGNPWTFPVMWYFSYALGVKILGLFGLEGLGAFPADMSLENLWDLFSQHPTKLFLPWMLGGYLLAILSWPIYFLIAFYIVRFGKRARAIAKEKRLKRKFKKQFHKAEHYK